VTLCEDVISWCRLEKRSFLRQRIEAKLANLLLQRRDTMAALKLVNSLLGELKKLDDKQMLTETHLTESRIYHSLKNIPKAKVYISIYVCINIFSIYLYINIYISIYIYIYVYVCIYIYIYVYMNVYYIYRYVCIYIYIQAYVYIYIYDMI
jgi:hypothetical protein